MESIKELSVSKGKRRYWFNVESRFYRNIVKNGVPEAIIN
jgi:hypothetical protein